MNDEISANLNDEGVNTLDVEYIVHFDLDCLPPVGAQREATIQKFLDEFECYKLDDT